MQVEQELDRRLDALLAPGPGADTPAEAEAIVRVRQGWEQLFSSTPEAGPRRRLAWPMIPVRRLTFSAGLAGLAAVLLIGLLTQPARALSAVSDAMGRVRQFHVRMELPGMGVRYEAWGDRERGSRVEEWDGGRQTLILLDDGRRIQEYDLEANELRQGETRLQAIFRQAANLSATRMLREAAAGRLLQGQKGPEWLGEVRAREVRPVTLDGRPVRRIRADLRGGFFERMILYADAETDLMTRADLFTDRRLPDSEPFASVKFDYPPRLDARLFQLQLPKPGPSRRPGETLPESFLSR